ncbi:hypothetical protein D9M70_627290 [compost metagenome]
MVLARRLGQVERRDGQPSGHQLGQAALHRVVLLSQAEQAGLRFGVHVHRVALHEPQKLPAVLRAAEQVNVIRGLLRHSREDALEP